MTKSDIRSAINALARLKLSDEQARMFIKEFAQAQMFKPFTAFDNFCQNCAIFYTNSVFTMSRKVKEGLSDDEYHQWTEDFIESCSGVNILKEEEMTVLKSITFVFENCESLIVEYPYVACLQTGSIYENFSSYSNMITKSKSIDGFSVVISHKAKVDSCEFTQFLEGDKVGLERFSCCDVTQLIITYKDGTSENISVLWTGEDDYTHRGQKFIKTEEGNVLFYSEDGDYKNTVDIDSVDVWCLMTED